MAERAITERDKDGLRLVKFRPFDPRGVFKERDQALEGRQTAEKAEARLGESRPGQEAA